MNKKLTKYLTIFLSLLLTCNSYGQNDSTNTFKNTIKLNPFMSFMEPGLAYERQIKNGLYISIKAGYRIPSKNYKSDLENSSFDLFRYYSGPIAGIGVKKGIGKKPNNYLELDLVYKYLFVNRANVGYDLGEHKEFTRYGGYKNDFTLKALYVKQAWYEHFLLEFFAGVGIKARDNRAFKELGYGSIPASGPRVYKGYPDYSTLPNVSTGKSVKDEIFPTIHFGINIGFGF